MTRKDQAIAVMRAENENLKMVCRRLAAAKSLEIRDRIARQCHYLFMGSALREADALLSEIPKSGNEIPKVGLPENSPLPTHMSQTDSENATYISRDNPRAGTKQPDAVTLNPERGLGYGADRPTSEYSNHTIIRGEVPREFAERAEKLKKEMTRRDHEAFKNMVEFFGEQYGIDNEK